MNAENHSNNRTIDEIVDRAIFTNEIEIILDKECGIKYAMRTDHAVFVWRNFKAKMTAIINLNYIGDMLEEIKYYAGQGKETNLGTNFSTEAPVLIKEMIVFWGLSNEEKVLTIIERNLDKLSRDEPGRQNDEKYSMDGPELSEKERKKIIKKMRTATGSIMLGAMAVTAITCITLETMEKLERVNFEISEMSTRKLAGDNREEDKTVEISCELSDELEAQPASKTNRPWIDTGRGQISAAPNKTLVCKTLEKPTRTATMTTIDEQTIDTFSEKTRECTLNVDSRTISCR